MRPLRFNYDRIASLVIEQDTEPENPRDWGGLGTLACWHKRYRLGDAQPHETLKDWLKANAPKGSVVLPVYMMDHSGLTFRTGASQFLAVDPQRFDWGQLGVIVASPDKIRETYQVKRISPKLRKEVEAQLRREVKTYDDFHNGNVWGYTATDDEGMDESCWGFFGTELSETGLEQAVPEHSLSMLPEAWVNRRLSST